MNMIKFLNNCVSGIRFVFLNFLFVCQNISACLKLNRPRLAIAYCYNERNEGSLQLMVQALLTPLLTAADEELLQEVYYAVSLERYNFKALLLPQQNKKKIRR